MRRYRLMTITAAAAAMLGLSGCGGGDSGPNAWTMTGSPWHNVDADIESWNEVNPDQAIGIDSFMNDNYKERIRTAIGSGGAPTLISSWGGGPVMDYAEQGYVLDITEETEGLRENMLDSVVASGEVDGRTYAVPSTDIQPVVLFHNQSVFDEAGVEVPQDWDDLLEVIDAINAQGDYPIALAGASRWPQLMWPSYLTDRLGGPEVYEEVMAGEPDAWSHPALLEALEMTQDLVERGAFDPNFSDVVADQSEDLQLLASGQAAMLLHTGSNYARMADTDPEFQASDDFGYTTFPEVAHGEGDPDAIVGNPSHFWSVSADASEEEQQVALDYLTEWSFSDEFVDSMLAEGHVPPLEGLDGQVAETEDAEFLTFSYGLAQDAPSFQLSWDQAIDVSQVEPLLENLELIYMLEITPEEFAESMNATQAG